MKNIFKNITTIAPLQILGFILFWIAWINGEVGGFLAFALLLLFINVKITLNR